jgi:hypothetical protein
VTEDQNGPVEPSFRVLERSDAAPGKSFDGGMRMTKAGGPMPRTTLHDVQMDDNIFADTKNNRYVALDSRMIYFIEPKLALSLYTSLKIHILNRMSHKNMKVVHGRALFNVANQIQWQR